MQKSEKCLSTGWRPKGSSQGLRAQSNVHVSLCLYQKAQGSTLEPGYEAEVRSQDKSVPKANKAIPVGHNEDLSFLWQGHPSSYLENHPQQNFSQENQQPSLPFLFFSSCWDKETQVGLCHPEPRWLNSARPSHSRWPLISPSR